MKYSLFCIITSCICLSACQKQLEGGSDKTPDKYISFTAGSIWNYQSTDSAASTPVTTTFSITSTAKDTLINGKSYHIFSNSGGGYQYINVTGNDYYEYDSLFLSNAGAIERLYLKDAAANTIWVQNVNLNIPNVPIAIPLSVTNTIIERGISRTVNNVSYADVIHVKTAISSSLIPASSLITNINTYYAKKYGLIENISIVTLNYIGIKENINEKTILLSADIK